MRHYAVARRHLGAALRVLILGLFLLPAMLPMLQGDALPCTHDNIFHSYRIVAMREMLDHGWVFSRWVPNLALGYGYPFFNYREPLPYLAGTLLYAAGVSLPMVLGLIYTASMVGAAWGAFELARDLFGPRAAWIAGIAYGLGPYVLLDPLRRGNMPESVALALIPWLFLTMRRILVGRHGRRRWAALSVMLLVTLFLSHNISSLLLAPFLGTYVVVLAWCHRDRKGWPIAFLAVGLAVLLTAWFWLPALTEQDMVQLHLSRTTRNNDFRYNFATWREILFTLPVPHDPDYLNPPMRIALGVGQWVLGAVGAVVGLRTSAERERRRLTVLFVAATLGYLAMATPMAQGIWERVPLLAFVQFPWRLVGRALLPVSLLAGQAAALWWDKLRDNEGSNARRLPAWASTAISGLVVLFLVVPAWPDTYPPKGMCGAATRPGMAELYARETEGWMGMDPESSYFPIWVEEHPTDRRLAEAFIAGTLPERLDRASLPPDAVVLRAEYRAQAAALAIRSPFTFRARWLGLYFPGWEVRIDGAEVEVTPEEKTGLMTFVVPSGEHVVTVRFGMTAVRRWGMILSILGGVLVIALSLRWLIRALVTRHEARVSAAEPQRRAPLGPGDERRGARTLLMFSLAMAALVVRLGAMDRAPSPILRSRLQGNGVPDVAQRVKVDFSGGLTLIGTTFPATSMPADEEFAVDLVWMAREVPAADYLTVVLLRGEDGQVWSPAGTERPRGYERPVPTSGWSPGAYAYDPHLVRALTGAPPGRYEVVIAVIEAGTRRPVSVLDAEGRPAGSDWVLGTVQLVAPSAPVGPAALGTRAACAPAACGPMKLLAASADRQAAAPGDVVAVRWLWEVVAASEENVVAVMALVGDDGEVLQTWELPPVAAWWPSEAWSVGERWVGRHVVRLPVGLSSQMARLAVSLPGCEALASVPLEIVAPERAWTVPEGLDAIEVRFGDAVTLVGVALPSGRMATGRPLEVTLAWRAEQEMATAYRVFLHLLNEAGEIVDQSDGEPVAWTRPTTGWAEGEVVTESRKVTLPRAAPAGRYRLVVGLYTPGEGRLMTSGGDDGYLLATLNVD